MIRLPLTLLFLLTAHLAHAHGGANVSKEKAVDKIEDGREIDLEFTSQIAGDLSVEMIPLTRKMKVKVGKRYKVEYQFKNNSGKDLPVLAVHSVFPTKEGAFFKKYVCFCFESQTLVKGADIKLPIEFRVTKDLAKTVKSLRIDYKLYEKKAPLKLKPIRPAKSPSKTNLKKRKASSFPNQEWKNQKWQKGSYGVIRRDGLITQENRRRV